MGFWNKLGKIALQAAPYVAAPFTGGLSLMATGATQKLGQKWAESDAKKAIAKGLEPSKFDKYLGMASAGAGLASSIFAPGGALGSAGKATSVGAGVGKGANLASIASKAGTGASTAAKVGGWANNVGKIANAAAGNGGGGWQGAVGSLAGQAVMNKLTSGGEDQVTSDTIDSTARGLAPSTIPASAQSIPSVAAPRASSVRDRLNAGRQQAVQNQPFRAGYQTQTQGLEDGEVITRDIPPIYSDVASNRPEVISPPISESTPLANAFTPRRARRRTPVEPVVEQAQ